MNQPGGNFVDNYVDSLTSAPQQQPPNAPPMPLPTTGTASGHPTDDQEPASPAQYQDMGTAAANADFQTGLGSGWTYDPDAMKAQITRLEELRDGILLDMSRVKDHLTDILAPGSEKVSRDFTEVANPSGASHNVQFDRYKAYLEAYIHTLYKIDRAYQDQDQAALEALRRKDT